MVLYGEKEKEKVGNGYCLLKSMFLSHNCSKINATGLGMSKTSLMLRFTQNVLSMQPRLLVANRHI